MAIIKFPPLDSADESGLLALGGDLEIESLILAYSEGIFPWPISKEYPLAWFSPDPRGVLFLEDFHINRSFKKVLARNEFQVTFNQNFEAVILNCSRVRRKNESGTWITDEIIEAYINLFRNKLAYSVEVSADGQLVGGLYGVKLNNYYSGESMFFSRDNASKVGLYFLIEKLKSEKIAWIDTQMVTPFFAQMGAKYLARNDFLKMLKNAV